MNTLHGCSDTSGRRATGPRGTSVVAAARCALVLAVATAVAPASAAQLPTRSALRSAIGGPGTIESFEGFSVAVGGSAMLGTTTLDSTTVANGQGPGLVVAGVALGGAGSLQWNGQGYLGLSTRTLLASAEPLVIDFAAPVAAFGVDLAAFAGQPYTAAVTIFAADDVTVLATPTINVPGGTRPFLGYAELGGIGKVELRDQAHAWSPIIDDLEFSFCGNGSVDALYGEQCEDGNIIDGDGCDHNCTLTACGNGIVAGTASAEQCDDGNTVAGDCCSPTCQFEASGSACASDSLPCSTDVCDGAGTCTHNASSSGTICRPSTGVCDPAEACNGTAKTCPPAGFASSGVCRPAVDVCDAPESCNGSGPDCPPDVYRTGECRPAAGACDLAESCTGSSPACPADLKSTAACRVAADACDFTELCDGVSDDCPANVTAADGTTCDDADTCTLVDTCQAGVCTGANRVDCDDGNGCTADSCDVLGNCINDDSPNAGCLTAAKSSVQINQDGDDSRDKVLWKWGHGESFAQADLGDPTNAASYALCVYAGTSSTLIADAALPPGPSWSARGAKGYKFKGTSPDGLSLAILQGGAIGKSRALVRGRGVALPDPTLPLAYPVTIQLKRDGSPFCLESTFTPANEARNTATQFKAR